MRRHSRRRRPSARLLAAGPRIDLAINKARTARLFDNSTAALGRLAQPAAELYGIQQSNGGDVVLIGGGLPVWQDGQVIGAIGASAGTVAQDVVVAEAAIAALGPASPTRHRFSAARADTRGATAK